MVCDARVYLKPVKIHSKINIRIHAVFPSNWWFNVDQSKFFFFSNIQNDNIICVRKKSSHAAYSWKYRKCRYTKNTHQLNGTRTPKKRTKRQRDVGEKVYISCDSFFFCWWNRKIWIKNYLLNGNAKSCVILVDDRENERILLANETIWCRLN